MKNLTKRTIVEFVEGNITKGRYTHQPKKFDQVEDPDHLKWPHQIVGNAGAFIVETYHGLGENHLQAYLSEFCFCTNRRLNACMPTPPRTYQALVNPVPFG